MTLASVRPEPVEGLYFTFGAALEEKGRASTSSARTGLGEHAERLNAVLLTTDHDMVPA